MLTRLRIVVLALLTAPASGAVTPQGTTQPNIIVMIADDLGYGDLGCYGSPTIATPRIDELASQGARFEAFYAHPVCTPTRAALMTGRYAARVGMGAPIGAWSPVGLSPDETTIAEMLAPAGYRSGLFGKWHLGDSPDQMPLAQGFDEFAGLLWGPTGLPLVFHDSRAGTVEYEPDQRFDTQRVTTHALDFIVRAHAADVPFFCVVSFTTPHVPATASPGFVGLSADGRGYGDAVEEMDASIGVIVDRLEMLGLTSKTLVVVFSDNGAKASGNSYQQGSNDPLRGGKGSTWEGGVRVPAVVRMPGTVLANHVVTDPTSVTDLLPTFARLAGVTPDPGILLDGVDIFTQLFGQPGDPARLVHMFRDIDVEAVRRGAYKYRLGELYDVVNDPAETTDLALSMPAEAASLALEIYAIRADILAFHRSVAPTLRIERRWRGGIGHGAAFTDGATWATATLDTDTLVLKDTDALVDLESIDIAGTGNTTLPLRSHRIASPSAAIRWVGSGLSIPEGSPFSIAFWYRGVVDDPDEDIALVDFGDDVAGLSITLGDAGEMGDDVLPGRRDDLLLRIGGLGSPASGTVAIDLPGDTSARFFHIVVTRDVVGDLVVHLDGFEEGRVNAPGATWAPGAPWSLFAPLGVLGGAGGSGVLPFMATRSMGEIAGFGAWDRALRQNEVESQYCRYVTYPFCTGGINSTGFDARLHFSGSFVQSDERLFIHVKGAPPSTVGFLLAGRQQSRTAIAGGRFCLASPFLRLSEQVLGFDASGAIDVQLDWSQAPVALDTVSTPAWNFQCWYRDGATSNFSNGTFVIFCR